MSRVLLLLSGLGLGFLVIGTSLQPDNPIFWLASSATSYEYLRIGLIGTLLGQLLTSPPRHRAFRLFTGLVSLATMVWAVQALFSYNTNILDTLVLMASSLAIGVTTLERAPSAYLPFYSMRIRRPRISPTEAEAV
jgi:hypothetical protein